MRFRHFDNTDTNELIENFATSHAHTATMLAHKGLAHWLDRRCATRFCSDLTECVTELQRRGADESSYALPAYVGDLLNAEIASYDSYLREHRIKRKLARKKGLDYEPLIPLRGGKSFQGLHEVDTILAFGLHDMHVITMLLAWAQRHINAYNVERDLHLCNEIWSTLSAYLKISRAEMPWPGSLDEESLKRDPRMEAYLVELMTLYEKNYPEYTELPTLNDHMEYKRLPLKERLALAPRAMALKERVHQIRKPWQEINHAFDTLAKAEELPPVGHFVDLVAGRAYNIIDILNNAFAENLDLIELGVISPFEFPDRQFVEHRLDYGLECETRLDHVLWLTNALGYLREEHSELCAERGEEEDTDGSEHRIEEK